MRPVLQSDHARSFLPGKVRFAVELASRGGELGSQKAGFVGGEREQDHSHGEPVSHGAECASQLWERVPLFAELTSLFAKPVSEKVELASQLGNTVRLETLTSSPKSETHFKISEVSSQKSETHLAFA